MPVPIRELQRRQKPLEELILECLSSDPDNGYALPEIVGRVERWDLSHVGVTLSMMRRQQRAALYEPYFEALSTLEQKGLIRQWDYQGQIHYSATKP